MTTETFTYASASIFVNSGTVRFYAYTNGGYNAAASVSVSAGTGWQNVTLQLPMEGYGYPDSNEIVIYSDTGSTADFLVDNVYGAVARRRLDRLFQRKIHQEWIDFRRQALSGWTRSFSASRVCCVGV